LASVTDSTPRTADSTPNRGITAIRPDNGTPRRGWCVMRVRVAGYAVPGLEPAAEFCPSPLHARRTPGKRAVLVWAGFAGHSRDRRRWMLWGNARKPHCGTEDRVPAFFSAPVGLKASASAGCESGYATPFPGQTPHITEVALPRSITGGGIHATRCRLEVHSVAVLHLQHRRRLRCRFLAPVQLVPQGLVLLPQCVELRP